MAWSPLSCTLKLTPVNVPQDEVSCNLKPTIVVDDEPEVACPPGMCRRQHRRSDQRRLDSPHPEGRVPRDQPVRPVRGEPGHRPQHPHRSSGASGGVRDPGDGPLSGSPGPVRVPAHREGQGPVRHPDDPLVIWRALVRAGGSQPSACLSPRLRQRGRGGGPLLALRGETEQEERPHPSPGRTGIGPPVGSLDRLRATAGFERPNPGKDATTDPPSGFEDTSWTNIPTPLSTDGPSSQVTSR